MPYPIIESAEFEKVLIENRVTPECQPYYKQWLSADLGFSTIINFQIAISYFVSVKN